MAVTDVFNLNGRVALVTGGSSGIGKECAKVLAQAGASVFIVGTNDLKLVSAKNEITAIGGKCECGAFDLAKESNCKGAVDKCVECFGRLDIVVNSAGARGANNNLAEEFSAENFRNIMAIDFESIFYITKYSYEKCAQNGVGSIINIASLAALYARGPIVYSAAKGAVKSFSRNVAKRFGPLGVRVNTIYPGFIVTEMTRGAVDDNPQMAAHFKQESPLGLLGESSDVAYCALYLASDAAKFVTGQDFVIDGGATC